MSSFKSSSGGGGRVIHQDFIARIRYSNNLPPPSIPPKLLDIPNTGLSSGQYTTPGFASRLAREQPLNIEADAELGMPLDLVGMPGIFEGDESAIQAPSEQPAIHAHDRALLRPLAALSRSKVGDQPVTFLRRTEYISSSIQRPGTGGPHPRAADRLRRPEKRPAETDDSPAAIRRKIDHSFEAAEAILADPAGKLKHPLKKNAKIVDSFPLLPDLDAFPEAGAYVTVKFLNPPVHSGTVYDDRLITGLFRPCERSAEEEEAWQAAEEAHARDPLNYPAPPPNTSYDFYLPQTANDAARFRARFDVDNPEHGEEELYTARGESGPCFQFSRLRTYDTVKEVEMDHKTKWDHELLLGFTGDHDIEGQKAAWYYPVLQRSIIRPQRQKRIDLTHGFGGSADGAPVPVDQLDVTIEDPSDELREYIHKFKEQPLGFEEEEEEEPEEPEQVVAEDTANDGGVARNGGDAEGEEDDEVGSPRERGATPSEEDAEGDDE